MKILVIGDLHGRQPRPLTKDFDAMVLVGDICDDRKIGPLYKKWFRALADNREIKFEEIVNETIGKRNFNKYQKESLDRGRKILTNLDKIGKPIFMVAGNWDQSYGETRIKNPEKSEYHQKKEFFDRMSGSEINPKLVKGLKNIRNVMFKPVEFEGVNFIGYGHSSNSERKYLKKGTLSARNHEKIKRAYKDLFSKLANAYKNRKNKRLPTFFITHNIPNGTKLDKITDKKSYAYGKHLGSTIARDFCSRFQPMVCVGGHIHEHRGKDKIKNTIVVNPGYGSRAQVLIEIDSGRLKKVRFLK